jgi:hypothetical protein
MVTYGVEAGEFKETLQFLLNPVKTLKSIFSSRMMFGGPKEKLSLLTDAYLQYRFALQPLLGLIGDTVELVQKGFPSFEKDKIYSHHSKIEDSTAESAGTASLAVPCFSFRTTPSIVESVEYLGSVQCTYQVPPGLASMLGLHLLDVPSIVWELTRLSFIIDRYIAIGPWIDSLRYNPETTILGGTSGIRRRVKIRSELVEASFVYNSPVRWDKTDIVGPEIHWDSYERRVENDLQGWPAINYGLSKSATHVLDEMVLILKSIK